MKKRTRLLSATARAALFAITAGLYFQCLPADQQHQEVTINPVGLSVGVAFSDVISKGEIKYYCADVTAGKPYSICAMFVKDTPAWLALRIYRDQSYTDLVNTLLADYSPRILNINPSSNKIYMAADAESIIPPSVSYTMLIVTTPDLSATPTFEGSASSPIHVAGYTPTVGQVSTLGASLYYTDDLAQAATHAVSICELTNKGVYFKVYGPDFFREDDCTLRLGYTCECTTITRYPIYFAVKSGPTNRVGAIYLIYVQ